MYFLSRFQGVTLHRQSLSLSIKHATPARTDGHLAIPTIFSPQRPLTADSTTPDRPSEAAHQQLRRHLTSTKLHGGITVTTTILLKPIIYPTPILAAAMLFNYTHVILLKSIVPSSKSLHSKWPILFNNTTNIFLKSIRHIYTIPF